MHISSSSTFLRLMKIPATDSANSSADSVIMCARVIMDWSSATLRFHLDDAYALAGAHRDLRGNVLDLQPAPLAHGQCDGRDDGHQQQHGGQFDRIRVAREQC